MREHETTGTNSSSPDRRRGYRSTLRAERAADTRARIVAAARELFAERGFVSTTVAAIAEHAGVAQPTVYAVFGGKGEIVRDLVAGLEDEAHADRWRADITAEPDPWRKLERYAAWHRELFATGRDLLGAALHAAGDPAVIELREAGDRSAREWLTPIVAALADGGALAPGLTEQDALDRAWTLTGFELYSRTTRGCGWTDDDYQRWLTDLLHAQLLGSADVR